MHQPNISVRYVLIRRSGRMFAAFRPAGYPQLGQKTSYSCRIQVAMQDLICLVCTYGYGSEYCLNLERGKEDIQDRLIGEEKKPITIHRYSLL